MNDLYLSASELKKYRIKKIVLNVIIYAFLSIMALFIVVPFYWMIVSSFKTSAEIVDTANFSLFPREWTFGNYVGLFKGGMCTELANGELSCKVDPVPFGWMYANTIIVGFFTTLLTVVTVVTAAFAFARLNFKGRELIFSLLLATMMIPGEIFVLTNYMTISKLGWIRSKDHFENYLALILPFGTSVFYTFFLRQTFRQIPNELYLAAKVDGTGDFKYLMKVMIPMAKASLTTIIILSMIGTWNAYIWPTFVTNSQMGNHLLISNGLQAAFSAASETSGADSVMGFQMAASAMVTIPLLVVFFCFRKYIMSGVSRSGIKG